MALIARLCACDKFRLPAFCGDIIGSVMDANGNPLQGVQMIVKAQNSPTTHR
jgi:hypothetical protein